MRSTTIDPRALWPLSYLSGRHGYRLAAYAVGAEQDVVSVDLVRGDVDVHVDWFPRTSHIMVSRDGELVTVVRQLAELADALEHLR